MPGSVPQPAVPPPTPAPPEGRSKKPEPVTIYLFSGRAIQGEILEEGPEEIKVRIDLKEGKGEVRVKRSQIVSIQK